MDGQLVLQGLEVGFRRYVVRKVFLKRHTERSDRSISPRPTASQAGRSIRRSVRADAPWYTKEFLGLDGDRGIGVKKCVAVWVERKVELRSCCGWTEARQLSEMVEILLSRISLDV